MATYNFPRFLQDNQVVPVSREGEIVAQYDELTTTTLLANADGVNVFTLPAGHKPVDFWFKPDDLDSGTTITFTIGYEGAANAFVTTSAVMQTGALAVIASTFYDYVPHTADRIITITITAGPATANGKLRALMAYTKPQTLY